MSEAPELHDFIVSDAPTSFLHEDKLGRKEFAHAIAQAISAWHGEESLVIAIQGAWGSGKTSVKNFVTEYIKEANTVTLHNFTPWEWPDSTKIHEAFFTELSLILGRPNREKESRDAATRLKRYAATLDFSTVQQSAVTFGTPLLALAATLGLGGALSSNIYLKNILLVLAFIFGVLTFASSVLKFFATRKEQGAEEFKKTAVEQHNELRNHLEKLSRPIVVFIDEIDRLKGAELESLFRLLKTNVNFPNLVYVLLFDQIIVEREMMTIIKGNPREYLQKIIQLSFNIPSISDDDIWNLLFDGMNKIFSTVGAKKRFHLEDEQYDLYELLKTYFKDLRSVKRYLASLNFHARIFDNEVYEVNPKDLILLEALRLFEPHAYSLVASSPQLAFSPLFDLKEDQVSSIIAPIVDASSHKEAVREILKSLFPNRQIDPDIGFWSSTSGNADNWYQNARLCHSEVFPRYFRLSIPSGQITFSEFDRFVERARTKSETTQILQNYLESGRLPALLSALEKHKLSIPTDAHVPLIGGLFNVGDNLRDSVGRWSGPESDASRTIYWIFRDRVPENQRDRVLLDALSDTEGVYLPIRITRLLAGNESHAALILSETAQLATQEFLNRIRKQAESRALLESCSLLFLLYRWREAGTEAEVIAWVRAMAERRETWQPLVEGFMTETVINGKRYPHYSPEADKDFLTQKKALELWSAFDVINPTKNEISTLELLRKPINRR